MESVLDFINQNIDHAPWIIFFLILLAGLNIPVSEDIMLVSGGAIASIYHDQSTLKIYTIIFFACWFSAWECYWIGRLLGPKLYNIRIFKPFISPEKVERLHVYYEKYGVFTFIIGRFIPGGVRNALFMSAGLGKMPFQIFILRDFVGALVATSVVFSIGYWFGDNYPVVINFIKNYSVIIVALIILLFFTLFYFARHKEKKDE